jgi:transcriptional regulator with XRE-family HTH domain
MFICVGFRENLKSELLYQGMLVKELAGKTGISRHTLDNYLNVRENMPTADVAVKIAQALGVTVEYLITGEEKHTENLMLKSEIQDLLQNFKQLSKKDRKLIIGMMQLVKNQNRNTANPAAAETTSST